MRFKCIFEHLSNLVVYVFIFICISHLKAVMENSKDKAGPGSASKEKGGAKVPDKKTKNPLTPTEPSREKKTTLKRRGDVEPPKFIGMCIEWECVCLYAHRRVNLDIYYWSSLDCVCVRAQMMSQMMVHITTSCC